MDVVNVPIKTNILGPILSPTYPKLLNFINNKYNNIALPYTNKNAKLVYPIKVESTSFVSSVLRILET